MSKLRCFVFDIETFPLEVMVWGRHDQNIALNQITKDWSVAAWAAKWLGDPVNKVKYYSTQGQKNLRDDRAILKPLWDLLNEADVVITQNGKNFDSPKLNARFISHGMPRPRPYRHLDTYQIIRSAAKFTSNSLEYLTDKLCTKYKKLSHKKFPGQVLWTECLKDNPEAWAEMRKYNIHDVLATEELYGKIKAWAPANAPLIYPGNPLDHCGTCGSKEVTKEGYHYTRLSRTPQIKCKACGRWTMGNRELQDFKVSKFRP